MTTLKPLAYDDLHRVPSCTFAIYFPTIQDNGADTLAPCPIGDVRVIGLKLHITSYILTYTNLLWAFVASRLTGISVPLGRTINAIAQSVAHDLFIRPPLAITFNGKVDEAKENKLLALGFSRQSSGKYRFFKRTLYR